MTGPELYDHYTHSCAAKQHWAGQRVGTGCSSAKGSHFGGRPAPVQPSAGRVRPDGAPRCAGVAEVMLRNRNTLCHADKCDGSDQEAVRAGYRFLSYGDAMLIL